MKTKKILSKTAFLQAVEDFEKKSEISLAEIKSYYLRINKCFLLVKKQEFCEIILELLKNVHFNHNHLPFEVEFIESNFGVPRNRLQKYSHLDFLSMLRSGLRTRNFGVDQLKTISLGLIDMKTSNFYIQHKKLGLNITKESFLIILDVMKSDYPMYFLNKKDIINKDDIYQKINPTEKIVFFDSEIYVIQADEYIIKDIDLLEKYTRDSDLCELVRNHIIYDNNKKNKNFQNIQKQVQAFEKISDMEKVLSDVNRSRKPLSEDVKMFVWRRDYGKCVQCGSNKKLEFDHIIPHSKGGSDTARNLQLLCESCNRKKSDII